MEGNYGRKEVIEMFCYHMGLQKKFFSIGGETQPEFAISQGAREAI